MSELLQTFTDSKLDEMLIDAYFQNEVESMRLLNIEVQRRLLAQEALSHGIYVEQDDKEPSSSWIREYDDENIGRGED